MNTPRDLLLEKHRAAGPQLDALRRRTVASLPAATAAGPAHASLIEWLSGWLWPNPHAWAGLAAAWAVAFALNYAAAPEPLAVAASAPTEAALVNFQVQRQELHALLDLPVAITPPRREPPKPHSRLSTLNFHA
jgi:hypothetical protein